MLGIQVNILQSLANVFWVEKFKDKIIIGYVSKVDNFSGENAQALRNVV